MVAGVGVVVGVSGSVVGTGAGAGAGGSVADGRDVDVAGGWVEDGVDDSDDSTFVVDELGGVGEVVSPPPAHAAISIPVERST